MSSTVHYLPFQELGPSRTTFAVLGRCSNRTPLVSRLTKTNKEMASFTFDLIDENDSEIRVQCLFEAAVNYDAIIQKGMVYSIEVSKGGRVRVADARFNQLSNRYEIMLSDPNFDKIDLQKDNSEIAKEVFNFRTLGDISKRSAENFTVDVAAVVKEVREVRTVITKSSGTSLETRRVVLYDDSEREVELTLWGEDCANPAFAPGMIVTIKSCNVRDYNGARSLTCTRSSTIANVPDVSKHASQRVKSLATWFARAAATGEMLNFQSMSERRATNSDAKKVAVQTLLENETAVMAIDPYAADQGVHESEVYCRIHRLVTNSRRQSGGDEASTLTQSEDKNSSNISYNACGLCRKKVTIEGDNTMAHCEHCRKQVTPVPTFLFRVVLSDHTTTAYASVFQAAGPKFFSVPCAQAVEKERSEGSAGIRRLFDRNVDGPTFKCRLRSKQEQIQTPNGPEYRSKVDIHFADRLLDGQLGNMLMRQLYDNCAEVKTALLSNSFVSGARKRAAPIKAELAVKEEKIQA